MKKYLLILSGLIICLLSSCSKSNNAELYQEIKSVDKLVLAKMSITKTAKMESYDWYTVGKRIAVYSYDTYMRAFVDLSALQFEDLIFDDENKVVKVFLPPIETEITGRDMTMNKVYDSIGFFRDSLDSKERAEIKEKANISFKEEVEHNPIFREHLTDAAKRKARKYFESIFSANGYTASIDFKTSKTPEND